MFVCIYLENFFFHNTLTLRLSVSSVKHKQNVSSTTKPRAIVYVGFELLWPFVIVKVHILTKYFLFMLELYTSKSYQFWVAQLEKNSKQNLCWHGITVEFFFSFCKMNKWKKLPLKMSPNSTTIHVTTIVGDVNTFSSHYQYLWTPRCNFKLFQGLPLCWLPFICLKRVKCVERWKKDCLH